MISDWTIRSGLTFVKMFDSVLQTQDSAEALRNLFQTAKLVADKVIDTVNKGY